MWRECTDRLHCTPTSGSDAERKGERAYRAQRARAATRERVMRQRGARGGRRTSEGGAPKALSGGRSKRIGSESLRGRGSGPGARKDLLRKPARQRQLAAAAPDEFDWALGAQAQGRHGCTSPHGAPGLWVPGGQVHAWDQSSRWAVVVARAVRRGFPSDESSLDNPLDDATPKAAEAGGPPWGNSLSEGGRSGKGPTWAQMGILGGILGIEGLTGNRQRPRCVGSRSREEGGCPGRRPKWAQVSRGLESRPPRRSLAGQTEDHRTPSAHVRANFGLTKVRAGTRLL